MSAAPEISGLTHAVASAAPAASSLSSIVTPDQGRPPIPNFVTGSPVGPVQSQWTSFFSNLKIASATIYVSGSPSTYKTSHLAGEEPLNSLIPSRLRGRIVQERLYKAISTRLCASRAAAIWRRSYRWTASCASSSFVPYLNSPTTPPTTSIIPILRSSFTHFGSSKCGCVVCLNSPTGSISDSSINWTQSRLFRLLRFPHSTIAWTISIPSRVTPIATAAVANATKLEKWRTFASSTALIGSSTGENENISEWLDRQLLRIAIGAVIFYIFCIWEFSIGIKKSIKLFLNSHFVLDICRYIAYIMPRLKVNESARHSKTDADHSGSSRGKLD